MTHIFLFSKALKDYEALCNQIKKVSQKKYPNELALNVIIMILHFLLLSSIDFKKSNNWGEKFNIFHWSDKNILKNN